MEKKPKYDLHALVDIHNLQMDMTVKITKRRLTCDYDTGEGIYSYDFVHVANIEKPWDWANVSEEHLDDLVWARTSRTVAK